MSVKSHISSRLRQFGEERYGSMAAFGRALDLRPQELYRYLSGQIQPGNKLQAKLRDLGCDLEWLMTGKESQLKKELAQFVKDHPGSVIPENLPEKTRKQIKLLIEEVSKLDEGEVEKAREIIRTIFKTKKGR